MMTWPLSPLKSYVRGTVVTSSNLNSYQDALVAVYAGTKSVTSLTTDGVGGNYITPTTAQLSLANTTGSDDALLAFATTDSQMRWHIDHLGFPTGRLQEFREDWLYNINATTVDTDASIVLPYGSNSKWLFTLSNTSTGSLTNSGNRAIIATGTLDNEAGVLSTCGSVLVPHSGVCAVVEFEVQILGSTSTTEWSYSIGLTSGNLLNSSFSTDGVYLYKPAGASTVWHARTISGGVQTDVATSVSFATGTFYKMRIEYYGSSSSFGNVARFFIDNSFIVTTQSPETTISTNLPNSVPLGFTAKYLGAITGGAHTASTIEITPIRVFANRQTSVPVV